MKGGVIVFLEGSTEKNVIEKLKERGDITYHKIREYGSAQDLREQLSSHLEPVVNEVSLEKIEVTYRTFVVFRDVDSGKSVEDIKKSTEDAVKKALKKINIPVNFTQHQKHPNIFFFEYKKPEIKVVLHVAQYPPIDGLPTFKNCTTDDYVLDLALRSKTIANLPEFINAKSQKKNLTPEEIQKKVKIEIFEILKKNGIELDEAKKFVNLYIASLQLGESMTYAHLPGKVIAHAENEDIKEVFESWIAAFNIFSEGVNE